MGSKCTQNKVEQLTSEKERLEEALFFPGGSYLKDRWKIAVYETIHYHFVSVVRARDVGVVFRRLEDILHRFLSLEGASDLFKVLSAKVNDPIFSNGGLTVSSIGDSIIVLVSLCP